MRMLTIGILALLWPYAGAFAQSGEQGALTIGQSLPPMTFQKLANTPALSISLPDKKIPLTILDLWATWCGSCAYAMPEMQKLQDEFRGKIRVIMVDVDTNDTRAKVTAYLRKRKERTGLAFDLPSIIQDTAINRYFPAIFIPQYIWLDDKGKILAITDPKEVTAENINRMLTDRATKLHFKNDAASFKKELPLFVGTNGKDPADFMYRSILTPEQPELVGALGNKKQKGIYTRLYAINRPLGSLLRIAWQEAFADDPVIEVPDSLDLEKRYCYELITPPLQEKDFFQAMRQDLFRAFQVRVTRQLEERNALLLQVADTVARTLSGTPVIDMDRLSRHKMLRNVPVPVLVGYLQPFTPKRIFDATGGKGNISLDFPFDFLDYSFAGMEAFIAKAGYRLVPAKRKVAVVVISSYSTGAGN